MTRRPGAPVVGVVCPTLGEASEPWLWRQIAGCQRIAPFVVTWSYKNRNLYPIGDVPVHELHELDFARTRDDGVGRWLRRARNVRDLNFFGTSGVERSHLQKVLLNEPRPQALLCHFGWTALRLLPVARQAHIPLVAHFHGLDLSSSLKDKWYRWSLRSSLRNMSAMIVVNDRQRDRLMRLGASRQRIFVIPCGVPTAQFSPAESDGCRCTFLFVGRFVQKKAPLVTIRAFARCLDAGIDGELLMIGDGPLLREAKALVEELGIGRHVAFRGAVGNKEVLAALRGASVYVQHSVTASNGDMEGWPVAIAEAASCGLPVVSTRHGGITSQILHGQTGFLVDEQAEEEMAHYMVLLAKDPTLRREMGARGRRHMRENFDARRQIEKLEEVVLSVLD